MLIKPSDIKNLKITITELKLGVSIAQRIKKLLELTVGFQRKVFKFFILLISTLKAEKLFNTPSSSCF